MSNFSVDKLIGKALGTSSDEEIDEKTVKIAVFIDKSVSSQMVKAAKIALRPLNENALMHIETFFDSSLEVDDACELTVIFANKSLHSSKTYAYSRAKGIPSVVIAESIQDFVAAEKDCDIYADEDDVIALAQEDKEPSIVDSAVKYASDVSCDVAQVAFDAIGKSIPKALGREQLVSDDVVIKKTPPLSTTSRFTVVFENLGTWIVKNCPDIKDVMAASFEFVREALSRQLAMRTSIENAGTALLFFTSSADFPIMALNQLRMLVQIERVYGNGISKGMAGEAGVVLAAGLVSRTLAKFFSRTFPATKILTNVGVAFLATAVMGHYMNSYCAGGKQLLTTSDAALDNGLGAGVQGGIDKINDLFADLIKTLGDTFKNSSLENVFLNIKNQVKKVYPSSGIEIFDEPVSMVFHDDGTADGLDAFKDHFASEYGGFAESDGTEDLRHSVEEAKAGADGKEAKAETGDNDAKATSADKTENIDSAVEIKGSKSVGEAVN